MDMPPALGNKMQVDDGASALSSSSISSPPNSPPQNIASSDTIHVSRPSLSNPSFSGDGVVNSTSGTPAQALSANAAAHTLNGNASTQANTKTNGTAPEKPKRQRKKKEVGPDGKPNVDDKPKEKKPRKPREPKAAGTGAEKTAAPRKKLKTEENTVAPHDASTQSRQPTITEMVGTFTQPNQPASTTLPSQPPQRISDNRTQSSIPPRMSNPPTPRPMSSGQNYDPIRGSTMDNAPPRPSNPRDAPSSAQTSPHVYRASASPAIASLIDPPSATKAGPPIPARYSPQTRMQQPLFLPSQHSPPPPTAASAFVPPPQPQPSPPAQVMQPSIPATDGAMDIDVPKCEGTKQHQVPEIKAHSSSSAPTPKAARPTPPPLPKATGSGLLAASDLFGGPSVPDPVERKGVDIDIQIPLNPRGGNTINIAQEIIRKYGRDALNPRAAAHRERIMRFAAEQRQFRDSNDDMSVDLTSEVEGDSDTGMGGMDDDKSNTGMDNDSKPVRKRRKKVEEYDKEDDFIDDTELAWQEQAAVAKDGFFVYSGPLVPEGQQAQVESSSSTRGSRGGRGRGRGSRSATTGTTHASLAEKSRDPTTSTRSRARTTRGTGAPRKPRITKADRERMEAEKAERERAGPGAGISGTSSTPVTLAPSLPQGSPVQQQPLQSYAQPTGTVA